MGTSKNIKPKAMMWSNQPTLRSKVIQGVALKKAWYTTTPITTPTRLAPGKRHSMGFCHIRHSNDSAAPTGTAKYRYLEGHSNEPLVPVTRLQKSKP